MAIHCINHDFCQLSSAVSFPNYGDRSSEKGQFTLRKNTPQKVISNTYSVAFPLKGIYICASSSPPPPVKVIPNAHKLKCMRRELL